MLKRRVFFFLITILAGLFSRSEFIELPRVIDDYIGDVLWGSMVFWMFIIIFYRKKIIVGLIYALLFSFAIELSQLYHAQWIDALRKIKVFGLILGYGFLYSDLICYSVGILLAYYFESICLKRVKARV